MIGAAAYRLDTTAQEGAAANAIAAAFCFAPLQEDRSADAENGHLDS